MPCPTCPFGRLPSRSTEDTTRTSVRCDNVRTFTKCLSHESCSLLSLHALPDPSSLRPPPLPVPSLSCVFPSLCRTRRLPRPTLNNPRPAITLHRRPTTASRHRRQDTGALNQRRPRRTRHPRRTGRRHRRGTAHPNPRRRGTGHRRRQAMAPLNHARPRMVVSRRSLGRRPLRRQRLKKAVWVAESPHLGHPRPRRTVGTTAVVSASPLGAERVLTAAGGIPKVKVKGGPIGKGGGGMVCVCVVFIVAGVRTCCCLRRCAAGLRLWELCPPKISLSQCIAASSDISANVRFAHP